MFSLNNENMPLTEPNDEFRVVGLTSPEMRYFLRRVFEKVTRSLNKWARIQLVALFCVFAFSAGCGKATDDSNNHGPTVDPAILLVMEDQMELRTDPEYLLWQYKYAFPAMEQLREVKEIRILSKDLDRYAVNESDIYLDPFDKDDNSLFPMVQVALPRPVIEQSPGQIRLSIPGDEIEKKLGMLFKFSRSEKYHHVRLRILMTDRSKPGNPVEMILIGTLWETHS